MAYHILAELGSVLAEPEVNDAVAVSSNKKEEDKVMGSQINAAPEDSTDNGDDQGGLNIIDAADVWRAPVRGVAEFGESLLNLSKDGLNLVRAGWGIVAGDPLEEDEKFKDFDFDPMLDATVGKTTSIAGGLIEGVTQFAAGMITSTKLLSGIAWVAKGGWAASAVKGAVADFIAFNSHEERLSNLIEAVPSLANPITDYLAADENDGWVEGRLKNSIEGIGLGVVQDSLVGVLKSFKVLEKTKKALAGTPLDPRVIKQAQETVAKQEMSLQDSLEKLTKAVQDYDEKTVADIQYTLTSTGDRQTFGEMAQKQLAQLDKSGPPDLTIETDKGTFVIADPKGLKEHFEHVSREISKGANLDDVLYEGGKIKGINTKPIADFDDMRALVQTLTDEFVRSPISDHATVKEAWQGVFDKGMAYVVEDVTEFSASELNARVVASQMAFAHTMTDVMTYRAALNDKLSKGLVLTDEECNNMAKLWVMARDFGTAYAQRTSQAGRSLRANQISLSQAATNWQQVAIPQLEAAGWSKGEAQAMGRFVMKGLKAAAADAGRELQDISLLGSERIGKLIKAMPMDEKRAFFGRLMAAKTPHQLRKLTKATKFDKVLKAGNQWWLGAILSSPKTHVVNAVSNTINSVLKPAELAMGRFMGGDGKAAGRAFQIYSGITELFKSRHTVEALADEGSELPSIWKRAGRGDGIQAVGEAFTSGRSVLDGTTGKLDIQPDALSAEAFNADPKSAAGVLLNGLGAVSKVPFKFLMGSDEFFRQSAYRGHAKMQIMERLAAQGLDSKSKEFAEAFAEEWDKFFDPSTGRGTNHSALEYAEEVTFTQTPQGPVESRVFNLLRDASNIPMLKPIIPFVRTPLNIVNFVWDRTPLMRQFRHEVRNDLLHGSAAAKAKRRGELATGCVMWLGAAIAANEGILTGSGPDNPSAKALWLQAGNQAYSVKVGDKYIQYSRLDPYGMVLGLAADFAQISGHVTEQQSGEVASMMVAALSRNLASKTYAKGLSDTLSAFMSGDEYRLRSWINQRAGSFVPRSLQVLKNDPYMREVRTVMDSLKQQIPGLSSTLPPKRNIFGEPVTLPHGFGWDKASPFAQTQRVDDEVKQELARLGHGFTLPPTLYHGLDLTQVTTASGQQAYDRYLELVGEVKINGSGLHSSISNLIKSNLYQKAPEEAKDEFGDAGIRVKLLQTTMSKYKTEALRRLRKEVDALDKLETRRAAENLRKITGGRRTSGMLSLL